MPAPAYDIPTATTLAIAEIQRLAQNGIAPSSSIYDARRRHGAPGTAWMHSHNISYIDLVHQAGLRLSSRSLRNARQPLNTGVTPAVEAEIAAAFDRGDHLPTHYHYNHDTFTCIPTRIEQFLVTDSRTGDTIRITRHYASIR
jgi:hypothetical protein